MTENSQPVGSRRGSGNRRSPSAANDKASDLKNAGGGRNLGLTEASIWRMSD
jgi:hypothetical protein